MNTKPMPNEFMGVAAYRAAMMVQILKATSVPMVEMRYIGLRPILSTKNDMNVLVNKLHVLRPPLIPS